MSDKHFTADVTIPSDLAEARLLQNQIEEALHSADYTEHDIFSIKLALEEALVNAIKHGNGLDPGKKVRIQANVTPSGSASASRTRAPASTAPASPTLRRRRTCASPAAGASC